MTASTPPDVLLDRDGVIVRERPGYVRQPDDVELLPGAASAVQRLLQRGHRVAVLTNQSAVGRGLLDEQTLEAIHRRLSELLSGDFGTIEHFFVCPHRPDAGCTCRKPRPGLFHAARDGAGIRLDDAVYVGDQLSDLAAAKSAGCRAILVMSGQTVTPPQAGSDDFEVAADLSAAVDLITSWQHST